MSKLENIFKLVGRLAISAIFVWAAVGKIMNPSGAMSHIQSAGIPVPAGLAYAVAVAVEAICGTLLIIGWRTRLAAFALFLFLIPATYFFHFDPSSRIQTIMALKNIAIAGGLFFIMAVGPGRLSLDKG
ncbi:hypothetical protein MNBD_NITROSPINAE03-223 [hydrothermal vent metagenome]|uniref:DoxX family protein n=1 Tax=hydrothermal vent metagenome TaxID=652676 RepID=A0A3B1CHQ9_9ZZZZ